MEGRQNDVFVQITTGTIVKVILLMLLVWALFFLKELVLVLLTAIVIASAIEPATNWFTKHKFPRVAAVLIVYLTFFGTLLSFFYFFVPPILNELINFLAVLPEYLEQFDSAGTFQDTALLGAKDAVNSFSISGVLSELQAMFSNISKNFLTTIAAIFGGVLSFVFIIVFSFYFSLQKTGIDDFLKIITPIKHQDKIINLWKRSQVKIGRWMQGQIILAVIVGMLVYLGLTILGVKYALLLAVIAGLFEVIPVFGPILSAIPATIIAALRVVFSEVKV